jgi:hypothetical protein
MDDIVEAHPIGSYDRWQSGVDLDDERWEEYVHSQTMHPNEAASMLLLMGTEAVQWIPEGEYVEAVPDQDAFTIEGNNR